MPYIGRSSNFGVRTRFLYTATASQTSFTGADTQNLTLSYSDSNFIDVHQNGVLLKVVDDYTATTGTSVVLATGATANDVIEITVYDVFSIANHIKKTGDAMAGTLTNIDIDGTELVLDSDGDTSITADTDDQIDFKTGGSDRVIIDSSGNVLVGRTSTISGGSNSASGAQIGSNGLIQAAVSGDTAIALQRLSDDGDIIQFRKDTTQVGSISVVSSDLAIFSSASSHAGLRLANGYIAPTNNSGTISDNTADLGISNYRFKDLYLSGGLHIGGTTAANKLEDYEEGTWTPSIDGRDFSSNKYGVYVKIGRVVYVHFECNTMTGGDDTDPYMTGLPFTSTNATSNSDYAGYLMIHEPYQISGDSTRTYAYFRVGTNTTQAQMLSGGGDGGEYSHVGGITMGNGDHMRGSGFYFTDA